MRSIAVLYDVHGNALFILSLFTFIMICIHFTLNENGSVHCADTEHENSSNVNLIWRHSRKWQWGATGVVVWASFVSQFLMYPFTSNDSNGVACHTNCSMQIRVALLGPMSALHCRIYIYRQNYATRRMYDDDDAGTFFPLILSFLTPDFFNFFFSYYFHFVVANILFVCIEWVKYADVFFLLQNRSTNGLCFVDEQQRASTRSICMVCILKNFLGQFQWIYVLQIIFCFYFVEMREHSMSVLTWNVFGHKSLGINILFKLFYSGSWIAGCFVMLF